VGAGVTRSGTRSRAVAAAGRTRFALVFLDVLLLDLDRLVRRDLDVLGTLRACVVSALGPFAPPRVVWRVTHSPYSERYGCTNVTPHRRGDGRGARRQHTVALVVLGKLCGTGADDTDTHGSGRELQSDRQRRNTCGDAGRARIESGDQSRELVAKRERRRCRKKSAYVLSRAKEQRLDCGV
jgi:hypothetical protein